MKQRIQLTGKNIDDLFRLPCVFQIQKTFVMGKEGNSIPNQNIEDCVIAVVQKPQSDSCFKWAKMGDYFDVPELKYSREQTINGTGYGWQNSEGKKPLACCLGIRPFLLYGEPKLSSLADDGLSHSSSGIPLEAKTVFDLTNQFIKIIKKQAEDDQ